jgi:NDP-sugar pyrophosphorylase family protein
MTAGLRRGGIIAAGDGTRLRAGGHTGPKALVEVRGVPLIEAVIRNFQAAGIESLVVIVNERARACVDWVRGRFPGQDIDFIVRTTRSSLESFLAVSARLEAGPALISTVDAWCRPADFVRFVEGARRRLPDGSVLGVTPLVADEKPLWATVDTAGRITRLGESAGPLVTAGFYLLSAGARADAPPPGLPRLRDYLIWLAARHPFYAEVIQTVVDVDRPDDVALAESVAPREPGT